MIMRILLAASTRLILMIDDDQLTQVLRINDELLQLMQMAESKA
jgi:hypothetical protein